MIKAIKNMFRYFLHVFSVPLVVNNNDEALKTEKWLKKTITLHIVLTIITMIYVVFTFVVSGEEVGWYECLLMTPILGAFGGCAFSSMALYFKQMVKFIFTGAKVGYTAGKEIKTTHVNISHEYGNNYSVSSYTDHKGLLMSVIMIFVAYMTYAMFCGFVAPFCTYNKARKTVKTLQEYRLQNPQI